MRVLRPAIALCVIALAAAACGDDDPPPAPPQEYAGTPCTTAAQCYPQLEGGAVTGTVTCLDKVTGGYCTHTCAQDSDCCAVKGECLYDYKQVCSPFESTGSQYCFLSCEDADMKASGYTDGNAYCARFAHAGFGCRSTGGGSSNRKICMN
jgi:hypothetical protein